MSKPAETKFDECGSCRHFVSSKCRRCHFGEFFEPDDDETEELSDEELMDFYRGMPNDE